MNKLSLMEPDVEVRFLLFRLKNCSEDSLMVERSKNTLFLSHICFLKFKRVEDFKLSSKLEVAGSNPVTCLYGKCSSDGRTPIMKCLFSFTYPFFYPIISAARMSLLQGEGRRFESFIGYFTSSLMAKCPQREGEI